MKASTFNNLLYDISIAGVRLVSIGHNHTATRGNSQAWIVVVNEEDAGSLAAWLNHGDLWKAEVQPGASVRVSHVPPDPKVYKVNVNGGNCSMVKADSQDDARRYGRRTAGSYFLEGVYPATEEEVVFHIAMDGYVADITRSKE